MVTTGHKAPGRKPIDPLESVEAALAFFFRARSDKEQRVALMHAADVAKLDFSRFPELTFPDFRFPPPVVAEFNAWVDKQKGAQRRREFKKLGERFAADFKDDLANLKLALRAVAGAPKPEAEVSSPSTPPRHLHPLHRAPWRTLAFTTMRLCHRMGWKAPTMGELAALELLVGIEQPMSAEDSVVRLNAWEKDRRPRVAREVRDDTLTQTTPALHNQSWEDVLMSIVVADAGATGLRYATRPPPSSVKIKLRMSPKRRS